MNNLASMPREQLELIRKDPQIGDVMREKIDAVLGVMPKQRKEAVVTQQLIRPVHITLPWSSLTSDNLKKGVAGKDNREKQAKYSLAVERCRNVIREVHGETPYPGPLRLEALFWFPDDRPRDPWNFSKALFDSLKGLLIVDDKWQELRRIEMEGAGIDCDRPRCELVVEPFTPRKA